LQADQFMNNWNAQSVQMGVQRNFQLKQNNWQWQDLRVGRSRDLDTSYQRDIQQWQWGAVDLQMSWQQKERDKAYQNWQLDFDQRQTGMRRQWQQQDFALERNVNQLQYGWQMEDIGEQLKYATGRQRRQLLKQRNRATISQGIEEGKLTTQEERAKESNKLEDEAFEMRKRRLLEDQELAETNFKLSAERHAEQRKWLDEDYKRDKERMAQRNKWGDEDYQRDSERLAQRIEYENELYKLQLDAHERDKTQFTEQQEQRKAEYEEAVQRAKDEKKLLEENQTLQDTIDTTHINNLREQVTAAQSIANAITGFQTMGQAANMVGTETFSRGMRKLIEFTQRVGRYQTTPTTWRPGGSVGAR